MINFFTEIFESTSDQARLVTTLIAALIAVVVVFVNQRFNSKRAKKEKLIEKIEEAFTLALSIQELSQAQHTEIVTNYDEIQAHHQRAFLSPAGSSKEVEDKPHEYHLDIARAAKKLFMLSALYFPGLKKVARNLAEQYQEVYTAYVSSENLSEYLDNYTNLSEKFHNSLAKLFEELSSIMNSSMH